MTKTVLITGGFGFLGRAVARKFQQLNYRVVGIGRGSWSSVEARANGFDLWLENDVTLLNLSLLRENIHFVVHCAGNGSVAYSLSNPLQDFKKTAESTAELLEFIRLHNPSAPLILPSSAAVYGAVTDLPSKESDTLTPISPYGHSKKIAEELCSSYAQVYALKIGIIRFFSVYGPGLRKQIFWDASKNIMANPREVIFSGTGDETRDFIYSDDAVGLISSLVRADFNFLTINGASGISTDVKHAIELLRNQLGSKASIHFNGEIRKGDPKHLRADNSLAKELGWQPMTGLQEGLRRYASWYRQKAHAN